MKLLLKQNSIPIDVCRIKVESLSYTMEDLIFRWEHIDPLIVEDTFELPQHNLIGYYTGICDQVYSSGNFTCVSVTFKLKRRIGYYIFHTWASKKHEITIIWTKIDDTS